MVYVVNGVGYEDLKRHYDNGSLEKNTEILVSLREKGFWNRFKEGYFKFKSILLNGSTYCGGKNLSCFFNNKGVLVSTDSREKVGGELEGLFENWGAIAARQDN